jgi:hypothetical protein
MIEEPYHASEQKKIHQRRKEASDLYGSSLPFLHQPGGGSILSHVLMLHQAEGGRLKLMIDWSKLRGVDGSRFAGENISRNEFTDTGTRGESSRDKVN